MDIDIIARGVHVLTVLLWIGGVALVTSALLPMLRTLNDGAEGVRLFHQVETRFAKQARITSLLAGGTGFHLLHSLHGPEAFLGAGPWWLYPMILVWAIFSLLLFVLEPLLIQKKFLCIALHNPGPTLNRVMTVHWILLLLSLGALFAAVGGAHGLF